jgi:glycosyltransferase involved in cell wall biosynthesis
MAVLPEPKTRPRVLLDGIFFLVGTGIGSVWRALFKELALRRLDFDLIVLSYLGAAPKIPGAIYLELPFPGGGGYPASQLELVCEQLSIDLFISTYYSFPEKTPSLLVVHDCIPEVFAYDMVTDHQWAQRKAAIERASSYLTISNHTTFDLIHFYPSVKKRPITVSRLGSYFQALNAQAPELAGVNFDEPFLVFISAFKNIEYLFGALELLHRQQGVIFQVIFTNVEASFVEQVNQSHPYLVANGRRFSEEELKWLYVHSAALIYPSVYEGFGLPVLDAVSCGGRVICGTNSSLPEASIGRSISVDPMDASNLATAISQAMRDRKHQSTFPPNGLPSAEIVSWTKFTNDFIYATNVTLDYCCN